MSADAWDVRPLSVWILGVARMHFSGGHSTEIRMCQADALSVQRQINGERGDVEVRWATSWIQYREEDIVLLEWRAEPSLGWPPMTDEARQALEDGGHRRGILGTLLDDWRTRETPTEPRFCAAALWTLFFAARDGLGIEEWREMAALIQGDDGARILRDLPDRLPRVPDEAVRDDELPEDAPVEGSSRSDQEHSGSADQEPHPSTSFDDPDSSASSGKQPEGAEGNDTEHSAD